MVDLQALLMRLQERARRQLTMVEQKLAQLALYERGTYAEQLGVKATTPCCVVDCDVTRRVVKRALLKQFLPPRPRGAYACHRCDTPKCINVEHLFWGTPKDNVRDMVLKGRHRGGDGTPLRQKLEREAAQHRAVLGGCATLLLALRP